MRATRLAAGLLLLFSPFGAKAHAQFSREGMKALRDLTPCRGAPPPADASPRQDANPGQSVLFLRSDLLVNPKPVPPQSIPGWNRPASSGSFGGFLDCRLRYYVVPGSITIVQTADGQRVVTYQPRVFQFPSRWVYFGGGHP